MFHRSLEAETSARVLRRIFADPARFELHAPLPPHPDYGDEGAANHTRLVTSRGTIQIAAGSEILHPGSPFNNAGTIRYHAFLPLDEIVTRDDFIIVEAGMPLVLAADLDDDGVPDTTDNNNDGRIDDADVEEDEDTGPLLAPPDPATEGDPRWAITRVISGAYPQAFANPLLVDVDGNGWTPPGLP
jgi:hypothetical protein